jgi:hypothetical protein
MKEARTKPCNESIATECRGLGQRRRCDVTVKRDLK